MPARSDSIGRAQERRRHLNTEIFAVWSGLAFSRPLNVACECGAWDCNESFNIVPAEFTAVVERGEFVLAQAHRAAAERRTADESRELAADIASQLDVRHRASDDAERALRPDTARPVPAFASR